MSTAACLTADGCWLQYLSPAAAMSEEPRPCLFLDRDGVLAEEVDYLHRVADLRSVPGAGAALAAVRAAGWHTVIVTNQSGIGRGYYGWDDFAAVQDALLASLATDGGAIDLVLACPHYPEHPWRKPEPGMLQVAARCLPIDLGRSWIVGDRASDLLAGSRAGLAGSVHVLTGYGAAQREPALRLDHPGFRVWGAASVAEVPSLLLLVDPGGRDGTG